MSPPCGCEVSLRPVRLQDRRGRAPRAAGHIVGEPEAQRGETNSPGSHSSLQVGTSPAAAPIPVLQARDFRVGGRGRKFRMQEEAQRGQASCLWLHSSVKSSLSSRCPTAALAPSLAVQVPIGGSGSPECDCKRLDSPSCVIRSEPAPSSGLSHLPAAPRTTPTSISVLAQWVIGPATWPHRPWPLSRSSMGPECTLTD